jgi:hypothetical protein
MMMMMIIAMMANNNNNNRWRVGCDSWRSMLDQVRPSSSSRNRIALLLFLLSREFWNYS